MKPLLEHHSWMSPLEGFDKALVVQVLPKRIISQSR